MSDTTTSQSNITTFWAFLNANIITIPIIQRDYAQGRTGEESLRKRFLATLKEAMDGHRKLTLDFVYGSESGKGNGTNGNKQFLPIDGQQRLTTLWLLHWYIALRAGKLKDNANTFKNFSYETRISSREFCECLCKADNFTAFDGKDITKYIKDRTWFYSEWNQDPTISSMLGMLGGTDGKEGADGIEKLFKGEKDDQFLAYWNTLIGDAPIKFYYQALEKFGLSDDLYIKMNARQAADAF